MNLQLPLCLGLVFAIGLTGCREQPPASLPSAHQARWLDVPALPIVQGAVVTLSGTLAPHKNPKVMAQLCALAKGEIQQEHINAFIKEQGGDALKIPQQGHLFSLLVNGDRKTQFSACAAYVAASVLTPLNLTELASPRPASKPGDTGKSDEPPIPQIDQTKLLASLPYRLAIAQANAELFALIATELQHRPGLTFGQYHQLCVEMFIQLAPDYLQRVKEHTPATSTEFQVLNLDNRNFTFIGSDQTLFSYDYSGLKLQQNGIIWLGEGKLLGKDYFLKVAYLPEKARHLSVIPTP